MKSGWYQRFHRHYAELRSKGLSDKQARDAAVQRLKEERETSE